MYYEVKSIYLLSLLPGAMITIFKLGVFGPVKTIKVMLSQLLYLTMPFLGRPSPLSSYPVLVRILSPETDNRRELP